MNKDQTKAPRIYSDIPLSQGRQSDLPDDQAHYLLTVMRKNDGDFVRVFNGKDGEWLARIIKTGKKTAAAECVEKIGEQSNPDFKTHLFFAPIKKDRMAFLIEKTVELGVTDLHPVMTDRTENRHLNIEKMHKQMIEAAEQCERTDIPVLHDVVPVTDLKNIDFPILAAIERDDHIQPMSMTSSGQETGFLVGPEGGWTENEINHIKSLSFICPVSLGNRILRAETASIYMLARNAIIKE